MPSVNNNLSVFSTPIIPGPLFNTLLTEYSDPMILDALDLLEDFQKQSTMKTVAGDEMQYAYDFLELKHLNHPKGRELDHARRRLISWYSKVRLFFEFDLLSPTYLGVIPGHSRTEFFISVVEPLDTLARHLDRRPPNPVFRFFRNQYHIHVSNITLDWERVPASVKYKKDLPMSDEEEEEDARGGRVGIHADL